MLCNNGNKGDRTKVSICSGRPFQYLQNEAKVKTYPQNHSCAVYTVLHIAVYLLLCFEGLKALTIVEKT
jgi:hypothetical protein